MIEKEREWRKVRGQLEGFEAVLSSKPIVAVGADHPLEDEILMADYFRGFLTDYFGFPGADKATQMALMAWLAFTHRFVNCSQPRI